MIKECVIELGTSDPVLVEHSAAMLECPVWSPEMEEQLKKVEAALRNQFSHDSISPESKAVAESMGRRCAEETDRLDRILKETNMKEMNRGELLEHHEAMCERALQLMAKKNADYSGGTEDAFGNFKMGEKLGVASAETGLLTRMTDKLARVISYVNKGSLKVEDESVHDSLVDLLNYAVILDALIVSRKKSVPVPPITPTGSYVMEFKGGDFGAFGTVLPTPTADCDTDVNSFKPRLYSPTDLAKIDVILDDDRFYADDWSHMNQILRLVPSHVRLLRKGLRIVYHYNTGEAERTIVNWRVPNDHIIDLLVVEHTGTRLNIQYKGTIIV